MKKKKKPKSFSIYLTFLWLKKKKGNPTKLFIPVLS